MVGGWAVVRVSAPPGGVGVGWAGRGDADRRVFAVAIVFVARVGASFMAVVQLLPPSDPHDKKALRLNLDETAVCLFQGGGRGNIFVEKRGPCMSERVP